MVHVRSDAKAVADACDPRALLAEGGSIAVTTATRIAASDAGPFVPIVTALERSGALRDAFVEAIPVPSTTAWSRLRWVALALVAAPLLMLLELDRELVSRDALGTGRFLADVLLAAFVVFELARKTPRMPAVAGAAMLAVAMRFLLVTARLCGKDVHVAVWGAAAAAVAGGLLVLARAPSRSRVALELLAKLGLSRSDVLAAKEGAPPPGRLVGAAVAAAAGLPLLLATMRRGGLSLGAQAAVFVAYGAIAPVLVRRFTDAGAASAAAGDDDAKEPPRASVVRALVAIAVGLTTTAALVYGTHQFFEAGSEVARCTSKLDEASRRMIAAEAAELARRIANVRASTALALMTTAVMPLAEERIYRGLLMDVLVKRYGFTYGLFASAAAFGVAHVGVYEIALYQTILLGIGFGLAYAEGGIVAAFVVHAVWNLLNVA